MNPIIRKIVSLRERNEVEGNSGKLEMRGKQSFPAPTRLVSEPPPKILGNEKMMPIRKGISVENSNMEHKKMLELQNKIMGPKNNIASTNGYPHDIRKRQFIKKGILGLIAGIGIAIFSKIARADGGFINYADGTSTTAGQIAFPATQSASSDANTLDDYEEGTWTPTLTDTSGNTGSGYTARNGYYTKIGRTVFFSGRILTNSISGLTGGNRANVAGLPFTSTGSTDGETVVSITLGRGGMDLSTGEVLSAYVNNSQTRFAMQKFTTTEYVNLTITEWTANGGCHFSGHYMV